MADEVKAARGPGAGGAIAEAALREATARHPNIVETVCPPGGRRTSSLSSWSGLHHGRHRWNTPSWAQRSRPSITERGAKVSGALFYFLTRIGAQLESRCVNSLWSRPRSWLHPGDRPALVKPEIMEGPAFLGAHSSEVYPPCLRRPLPGRYVRGGSRRLSLGRDLGRRRPPTSLRRVLLLLPARGRRYARTPGHHPGGHWFDKVEMFSYVPVCLRRAPPAAGLGADSSTSSSSLYRVIMSRPGDLGSSAARKFDIEAWFPSQGAYPS